MSDKPRDLTLERVNRLSQAVADLMENHAAQNGATLRMLGQIVDRLDAIDAKQAAMLTELRGLGSEQALLGNRVETAFARAMRANVRLDELEDANGGEP